MSAKHGIATPSQRPRPDLNRSGLLLLLAVLVVAVAAVLLFPAQSRAGTPVRQALAIAGSLLLLTPAAFSIMKRSGASESPPGWFVLHVLASSAGCVLVAAHAAGGSLFSAPGLLLALLLFVVIQGLLARALLAPALATRFAASPASFTRPDPERQAAIARLIAAKQALLGHIDTTADEALFSPTLAHWLRHPLHCHRYQRLAAEESDLVGSRARAGALLTRWRLVHMLAAWLFLASLAVHVVLGTFFAGYVAEGDPVYWWHVTAWGGP